MSTCKQTARKEIGEREQINRQKFSLDKRQCQLGQIGPGSDNFLSAFHNYRNRYLNDIGNCIISTVFFFISILRKVDHYVGEKGGDQLCINLKKSSSKISEASQLLGGGGA